MSLNKNENPGKQLSHLKMALYLNVIAVCAVFLIWFWNLLDSMLDCEVIVKLGRVGVISLVSFGVNAWTGWI